jgi:hypothetical protein
VHLCFDRVAECDDFCCSIATHSGRSPDLVGSCSDRQASREGRGIPVYDDQGPVAVWQAALPSEQQGWWVELLHICPIGLKLGEPFVEVTHCRAQRRQNGLGLIPLVYRFRSPDKLVEWYEERRHALDAAKLVSGLSAQFGHSPWQNFRLVHHIVEQLHRLVDFSLCNEQFPV